MLQKAELRGKWDLVGLLLGGTVLASKVRTQTQLPREFQPTGMFTDVTGPSKQNSKEQPWVDNRI